MNLPNPCSSMAQTMSQSVKTWQDAICSALNQHETKPFTIDTWQRPEGGGGITRVVEEGTVFEKAGVNVSTVFGELPKEAEIAMASRLNLSREQILSPPSTHLSVQGGEGEGERGNFFATGLSLVLHPKNPFAPTAHCNYRYFEYNNLWWFGGGADLTPAYLDDDDARHFHRVHSEACGRHDPTFYARMKQACDQYFFLPHRGETRGIGGIFFDDMHDRPQEELLAFVRDCAQSFCAAYVPILERRKNTPFSEEHREWQQLRRGRYVEFNLLYDRGTLFGLKTKGRIESILMSLPLVAKWHYDFKTKSGSEEECLIEVLRHPREWV